LRRLVVDANVAVKWVLPEEHSIAAARLLDERYELWAPDLIWAEAGNVFWKKWRQGEILAEEADVLLRDLPRYPIRILSSEAVLAVAWQIASTLTRSFYDSLYLALAADRACPLVTADRKLYNALSGGLSPVPLLWIEDIG
jgi:predicted nucleic acid-binding protein